MVWLLVNKDNLNYLNLSKNLESHSSFQKKTLPTRKKGFFKPVRELRNQEGFFHDWIIMFHPT